MEKSEWLKDFEERNGRKPSQEEFLNAKKNNFTFDFEDEVPQMSEILEEDAKNSEEDLISYNIEEDKKQIWLKDFEDKYGRKPSPEEFLLAKKSNFDFIDFEQAEAEEVEDWSVVTPSKEKQPLTKKHKIIIGAVIATLVLLLGGYLFGKSYYSEDKTLERYVKSYNKSGGLKEKDLKNYVWSDNMDIIQDSEFDFYPNLPKEISKSSLLKETELIQVGKRFFVFPNYKIAVNPKKLEVTSNIKDMELSVNDGAVGKSKNENYAITYSRVFPGKYTASAQGKIDGKETSLTDTKDVYSDEVTVFDLSIKYLAFNVESNLKDGDLYIGKDKVATLKDGSVKIPKRQVNEDDQVVVKKKVNGKELESDKVKISAISDNETVSLDSPDLFDKDSATKLLDGAFSKLSSYGTDRNEPSDLDEYFKDGSSNPFYIDAKDMIDTNTVNAKNRSADSVKFSDISVKDVKEDGDGVYIITFDETVTFDYPASTDRNGNTSGQIIDRVSWSAKVEQDDYNGSKKYKIIDKNGDSKSISRQNTVS